MLCRYCTYHQLILRRLSELERTDIHTDRQTDRRALLLYASWLRPPRHNDENEEDLLMEEEDSIEDTLAASNESEKKHVVSTTWKPFGAYFELKLKLVDVSCDSALPANPFYQPKFVTKLQKSWLPTSPFWSSMLRGAIHTCFQ